MKNLIKFFTSLADKKKTNELEALDKNFKLDLICEECGNPSRIINLVKSLFICLDCKEAKDRRERLLQAEKDFNST